MLPAGLRKTASLHGKCDPAQKQYAKPTIVNSFSKTQCWSCQWRKSRVFCCATQRKYTAKEMLLLKFLKHSYKQKYG